MAGGEGLAVDSATFFAHLRPLLADCNLRPEDDISENEGSDANVGPEKREADEGHEEVEKEHDGFSRREDDPTKNRSAVTDKCWSVHDDLNFLVNFFLRLISIGTTLIFRKEKEKKWKRL